MKTRCAKCGIYGEHSERVFDMTSQQVKDAEKDAEKMGYPEVNTRPPGPLKTRLTKCHACGHRMSFDISPESDVELVTA